MLRALSKLVATAALLAAFALPIAGLLPQPPLRAAGEEEILYPIPSREQLYPGAKQTPGEEKAGQGGTKAKPKATPSRPSPKEQSSSRQRSGKGGEAGVASQSSSSQGEASPEGGQAEPSPKVKPSDEGLAKESSQPGDEPEDVAAATSGEEQDLEAGALGIGEGEELDTSPIRTGFIDPGTGRDQAVGLETGSPLDQWNPWRALGWVVAILGLLIIFASLVRRMNAGRLLGLSGAGLSIVEALNLGQGRQILVVRTPDEDLILGVTKDSITLLSSVPRMPRELREEMERVAREEAELARRDEWEPTPEAEARRFARRVMFEQGGGARTDRGEELSPAGRRFLEKLSEKLSQWEV